MLIPADGPVLELTPIVAPALGPRASSARSTQATMASSTVGGSVAQPDAASAARPMIRGVRMAYISLPKDPTSVPPVLMNSRARRFWLGDSLLKIACS